MTSRFDLCLDVPPKFFTRSISTVTKLLGRLYYYDPTTGKPGNLPVNVSLSVNLVALCGTLAGQVTILPLSCGESQEDVVKKQFSMSVYMYF